MTVQGKKGVACLRPAARLCGAGLLAIAGLAVIEERAAARENPGWFGAGPAPQPFVQNRVIRSRARRLEQRPRSPSAPKQAEKKETPPPPGPHILVVSVKSQRVSLYANGKLVAQSPVSTGMETHPTPHGVFSIIQRNRHHRSNIYSGAPMPYMQRLTWSGVALHQGVLPGRPASHGCIRLPEQFASFLWRTTRLGTRVVVAREDTEPQEIVHAALFQPRPAPSTVETLPPLRKTLDTTAPAPLRTAGMQLVITDAAEEPVPAGDAGAASAARNAPAASAAQKPDDRAAGDSTQNPTAPALARKDEPQAQDSVVAGPPAAAVPAGPELAAAQPQPQSADIPDAILTSFVQSLQAKQKKAPPSGPVSVFVSRKDGRLYVRQSFIPLFTAKVTIRDDEPVGTHVFTALDRDGGEKGLRWVAITLPTDAPRARKTKPQYRIDARGRQIEVAQKPQPLSALPPPPGAASVLDRIEIAPDVVARISEYMTAGASLIVSDHGLGYETGLYTDFIVVTR